MSNHTNGMRFYDIDSPARGVFVVSCSIFLVLRNARPGPGLKNLYLNCNSSSNSTQLQRVQIIRDMNHEIDSVQKTREKEEMRRGKKSI